MTTTSVVPPLDSDNLKHCSKCGEWKPTSEFHRQSDARDGRTSRCKSCVREYQRAWREADPEKHRRRKHDWHMANAEQVSEKRRARYAANREHWLARNREWRAQHRNHLRLTAMAYREKYRDTLREKKREYNQQWVRANPEKMLASVHRRLARKRGLPATFTSADWQAALDHFGGCCAVCGRPPGLWHTLAADHWIPISAPDCPGTVPANIVPLCHGESGCNNSKSNKNAAGWLMERFGKRKAATIQQRIEAWLKSRGG